MQAAGNVDVTVVIDQWKAWKKQEVRDGWKLFYNNEFHGEGLGFESFKEAMIAISDGKWDVENQCVREEANAKEAYPVVGIYKYAKDEQPKRIKLLGFGYCDDTKSYGGGLNKGKKKMAFAGMKGKLQDELFEGLKGPLIQQWSDEGMINTDALLEWFNTGDRM